MGKYRIKTEYEFLNEYGENWRSIILARFPENMDYLLGCSLKNIETNEILNAIYNEDTIIYDGYIISYQMLTYNINYKPKKIKID